MKHWILIGLLAIWIADGVLSVKHPISSYKQLFLRKSMTTTGDAGEPLFLSQYLPNNPEKAKQLSEVTGLWKYPSYAGYFTVDNSTFSNMFFWFFPAQSGNTSAPLLVWLQGGPGGSSLYGLFSENGPFSVTTDLKLQPNPYTWNKDYHMVYVDNPVGVGFSFTKSNSGFSTNEDQIANNLYSLFEQFFQVYSDYAASDFYITGESYAGKYVPSFAYKVHQEKLNGNSSINLKGIAVGDGSHDPLIQCTGYGPLLYNTGLADENQVRVAEGYEHAVAEAILAENWEKAFRVYDEFMNGDFWTYGTYVFNITGFSNYFNYMDPQYPANPYPQYVNQDFVRNALHVGTYGYEDYNSTVEQYLITDWMQSVADKFPTLLNNYKVMLYNGQLDIILGPALAEHFYRTIPWDGAVEYANANRIIWRVDKEVAGYVRHVRGFSQVVVRKAGHLVPADQPQAAQDMITRFINDNWSQM